jgi:peptidoglycan/xylan/chitin deacetylase (PgdA/CDA1 family)
MNDDSRPSRDFIGYADQPPAVVWPDEARIAVNFCINYEEGAELCVLNGDNRSEVRVSDVAVETRIGGRDLNIESSYEYGSRVGYWRLLKAFTDRDLKATVNLVGLAGWQNPKALRAMIDTAIFTRMAGAGSTITTSKLPPNGNVSATASSRYASLPGNLRWVITPVCPR